MNRPLVLGLLAMVLAGCSILPAAEQGGAASSGPAATPTALERLGPTGQTETARVVAITDGDTIRVLLDGQEERVRYIGIDTPELHTDGGSAEPLAEAARTENATLVDGATVILETDVSETDQYGRLLRYVWLAPDEDADATDASAEPWTLVNLELVRAGLAEARDYRPDTKYSDELHENQAAARDADRGLWAR